MHENPGLKKGSKITMFDWYLRGKSEDRWVREIRANSTRQQHARVNLRVSIAHLLMRNKRLWNICQLGKNVFPKDLRNILKVIFCKLIQIYRVRLCSTPEIMLGKQSVNQRSLIKEIDCLNGCYVTLYKKW